jgi:hypothetical protein
MLLPLADGAGLVFDRRADLVELNSLNARSPL